MPFQIIATGDGAATIPLPEVDSAVIDIVETFADDQAQEAADHARDLSAKHHAAIILVRQDDAPRAIYVDGRCWWRIEFTNTVSEAQRGQLNANRVAVKPEPQTAIVPAGGPSEAVAILAGVLKEPIDSAKGAEPAHPDEATHTARAVARPPQDRRSTEPLITTAVDRITAWMDGGYESRVAEMLLAQATGDQADKAHVLLANFCNKHLSDRAFAAKCQERGQTTDEGNASVMANEWDPLAEAALPM